MTKEKLIQVYEDASNGIMRHELAANMLSEVCETALELFKTVEQQNTRLKKYQRSHSPKYVPD